MERHDPALTSTRVHVLDLCPRKSSHLHSMFYLLCQLPLYDFDISSSSTKVTPLFNLH
ncbi:hypothetical protein BHE74_00051492 [Ensete ventricosum]|nr:hypothetical protein GW17_00007203 [Ensete ventricosum]RWW42905.1 hypothetical protein BHE74_00051492 [Ensete ventricosum]RZR88976.1 hypothetical protein BHM03_00016636 [Ensete ventricosum]